MNRINTLSAVVILIAMVMALPQLAYAQKKDGTEYQVVINHEEQYSIWMAGKEPPSGWKATGFVGSKAAALNHIEEVWTDMRPLSNRKMMAEKIYRKQQGKE